MKVVLAQGVYRRLRQIWFRIRAGWDFLQGSTLAFYRPAESSALPSSPLGPLVAVSVALLWIRAVPLGFFVGCHASLNGCAGGVPLLVLVPGVFAVEVPLMALQYAASPVVWRLFLSTVNEGKHPDR